MVSGQVLSTATLLLQSPAPKYSGSQTQHTEQHCKNEFTNLLLSELKHLTSMFVSRELIS